MGMLEDRFRRLAMKPWRLKKPWRQAASAFGRGIPGVSDRSLEAYRRLEIKPWRLRSPGGMRLRLSAWGSLVLQIGAWRPTGSIASHGGLRLRVSA